MNEQQAKKLAKNIRDLALNEKSTIQSVTLDGRERPLKFQVDFIDGDKQTTTIETTIPGRQKTLKRKGEREAEYDYEPNYGSGVTEQVTVEL